MDSNLVVFDISSDEEASSEEGPKNDYNDWISELLGEGDRETEVSDEVVVVGEVNSKQNSRSLSVFKSSHEDKVDDDDDDDDDCVVLDGDPDNPVSEVNDAAASGSDDLVVVSMKGQIACRDYPHARYQCVKYPFSSTPHERHCDQCHCYVCDSLAPCAHWSTGISSVDHCHATDKEERWKLARKSFKQRKSGPQPASKFLKTSQSVALPQLNEVPMLPQSTPQNQVFAPTTIRACSSSANLGIPNITNQGRSQRAGFVLAQNRFLPHGVSQSLLGVRNNSVRRDRSPNVGNLRPQLLPSQTMFKRPGPVGCPFTVNKSGYGPPNNFSRAYSSQYSRNFPPPTTLIGKNPVRWPNSCSTTNLESNMYQCAQPNMSDIFANTVLPQSPASNQTQPIPPSIGSQNIYQHGDQTRNAADSNFVDFSTSWVNNSGQSNQQPLVENSQSDQQPPLENSQSIQQTQAENTQLQSSEPTDEPSLVTDFNSQLSGCMGRSSLYFDFEWLLEDPPVPGISEASMPSEPNIVPPDSPTIDPGLLLFDFDTTWNGLAHA